MSCFAATHVAVSTDSEVSKVVSSSDIRYKLGTWNRHETTWVLWKQPCKDSTSSNWNNHSSIDVLFRSLIIVITAYKNIHMHIHIFWVKHPTLTGHLSCRKLAYGQIKGRPFPLGKEFDAEIGRRKTGQVEDHPTASSKKNVGIFLKYFQNQFVTLFPKFTPEKQLPVFC